MTLKELVVGFGTQGAQHLDDWPACFAKRETRMYPESR
ncbi:NADH-quinone oxidoreductase subunit I [Serratia odorifera]|uniref:NADH-quinone oxidoreductase subunit I n=1 Tax=Serratia odorifera TaxID=618 RepID=A0A3S4HPB1_SEROD|nr:NADH-quinone oxidoreductase subunit I [Serratia odorifera]